MGNLKISTRLAGAFGLLVLLLVGMAVAAYSQLSSIHDDTLDLADNWLPSVQVVNQMEAQATINRVAHPHSQYRRSSDGQHRAGDHAGA